MSTRALQGAPAPTTAWPARRLSHSACRAASRQRLLDPSSCPDCQRPHPAGATLPAPAPALPPPPAQLPHECPAARCLPEHSRLVLHLAPSLPSHGKPPLPPRLCAGRRADLRGRLSTALNNGGNCRPAIGRRLQAAASQGICGSSRHTRLAALGRSAGIRPGSGPPSSLRPRPGKRLRPALMSLRSCTQGGREARLRFQARCTLRMCMHLTLR